jgi:hypothetical protein
MTQTAEQPKKERNPKRTILIELSNQMKTLRNDMAEGATTPEEALYWASRTINFMLLNHVYNSDGSTEFNTFRQWKEKGATIKKGSVGYVIWGQPVGRQRAEKAEAKGQPETDDSDYEFFPLCYLFSDKQVITAEELETERARKQEEQKQKEEHAAKLANLQAVELD